MLKGGNWYFFDTQIESSWFNTRQANYNGIPYHWFMQPVRDSQTIFRYFIDEEGFALLDLVASYIK